MGLHNHHFHHDCDKGDVTVLMAAIKSGLFMKLGTSLLSKESLGSLKEGKETKSINTPVFFPDQVTLVGKSRSLDGQLKTKTLTLSVAGIQIR